MKIAVRYQSNGGNTKTVAEIIANTVGVAAKSIDSPISESIDLLFVGGGVHKWSIDPSLKMFLENLSPGLVKNAAVFTTTGWMDKTDVIVSTLKSRGINVCDGALIIRAGVRNHAAFGKKGVLALTENEIKKINAFSNNITSNIKS